MAAEHQEFQQDSILATLLVPSKKDKGEARTYDLFLLPGKDHPTTSDQPGYSCQWFQQEKKYYASQRALRYNLGAGVLFSSCCFFQFLKQFQLEGLWKGWLSHVELSICSALGIIFSQLFTEHPLQLIFSTPNAGHSQEVKSHFLPFKSSVSVSGMISLYTD